MISLPPNRDLTGVLLYMDFISRSGDHVVQHPDLILINRVDSDLATGLRNAVFTPSILFDPFNSPTYAWSEKQSGMKL